MPFIFWCKPEIIDLTNNQNFHYQIRLITLTNTKDIKYLPEASRKHNQQICRKQIENYLNLQTTRVS